MLLFIPFYVAEIFDSKACVAADRANPNKDSPHATPSAENLPQPPDARCPFEEQHGRQSFFPCTCVESHPNSKSSPQRGPTLIIVKPSLFSQFLDESDRFLSPDAYWWPPAAILSNRSPHMVEHDSHGRIVRIEVDMGDCKVCWRPVGRLHDNT